MTHPAPTGSAEQFTSEIDKFMKEIREGWEKAVNAFNDCVEKIKDKWWLIAGGLAGAGLAWLINSKLNELGEGMKRIAEIIRTALERHTPVVSLIIASFRWTTDVKANVSNLSSRASNPASENLANWTGPAASRYKEKVAEQKAAIDETTARAEFISGWLFKAAKSNVAFAKKLAEIVTALVGKVVDAATEAGTVIGLAVVANTLGDAAGKITESALNVLLQIGEDLINALGEVRDLWGVVMDNTKMPNGQWPQAVKG
ncbi:hypothetical protein [Allorhizocola rhizosphaerae]|uniref:hypothetical protein n=1 Tax=Allorhizocola rhizosphaerae TaxID=1872709 RepID=UPI000E3DB965|nr:hypothetical protein [Allorhizocola rhizosphaerae]